MIASFFKKIYVIHSAGQKELYPIFGNHRFPKIDVYNAPHI